ncbi:MAG: hypothetical protein IMW86_04165 [Hydrogenibacillus sp.]|nr:hypothetical protein [Hydrogenibacillus sp.]
MLWLSGEGIEGRTMTYGAAAERLAPYGYTLGGGWEFEGGYFDALIASIGESQYYLRLPVRVLEGALDDPSARIVFGRPFLLHHVVHHGVAPTEHHPYFDSAGLSAMWNQFQPPKDPDAAIEDEARWRQAAEGHLAAVRRALETP